MVIDANRSIAEHGQELHLVPLPPLSQCNSVLSVPTLSWLLYCSDNPNFCQYKEAGVIRFRLRNPPVLTESGHPPSCLQSGGQGIRTLNRQSRHLISSQLAPRLEHKPNRLGHKPNRLGPKLNWMEHHPARPLLVGLAAWWADGAIKNPALAGFGL